MWRVLASVIGHKDRIGPLRDYCTGLMLPCERKSVEPMAAVTAPSRTAAQHQSLLHFVGEGGWSDERVLAKVHEVVLPAIERAGPVEAWIIDDTGFPKQGRHSVGVVLRAAWQTGQLPSGGVPIAVKELALELSKRAWRRIEWREGSAESQRASSTR